MNVSLFVLINKRLGMGSISLESNKLDCNYLLKTFNKLAIISFINVINQITITLRKSLSEKSRKIKSF